MIAEDEAGVVAGLLNEEGAPAISYAWRGLRR
jgi:hypothetical protein